MPLPLPAVPGSRIVHDLTGDELLAIATSGSLDNQTTTRDVANLAGGASNALLVESGSSTKISDLPSASHPLSVTNTAEGVPAVQVDGDDDLVDTFLTRGNLLGTPLTNITRTFVIPGMGPNSLVGHEYSTIMCEATGALTLQLGEVSAYDTEAQGANYTVVMVSEPGASVEILATADDNFNWGSNFSPNGGTLTTTQPGSSITISGNPDGFTWFVDSFEGTWTMTTTGSPVTFTSPSAGGGGSGNTLVLTADTNIAAGTSVSVNSAGHATQTWGPAPNVAGVVSIVSNAGLAYGGLIGLSSTQFVGWTNGVTGASVVVPVTKSVTALTVGTPNSGIVSGIGVILPLSATTFLVADQTVNCFFATVSGSAITAGASAAASASIVGAARLSATSFVLALGNGTAQVGTVSGTTISFGTAVTMGSGSFNGGVAQVNALSGSLFVVCFGDSGNSNEFTAVAATVSGNTITAGTAVSAAGSSVAYLSASGPLSTTHFAMGYSVGASSAAFAIVGSVSGTVVTLGTPVLVSYSTVLPTVTPQPATGGVPLAFAVIDATHVAFGAGGVYPLICSISGTTLTVPTPVILSNSGYPTVLTVSTAFASSVPTTSLAINSIVAVGSNVIVSDGVSNVYEIDSSNNISPSIQHPTLWNYGLTPADSTTVVAWFTDWNDNFQARVITFEPVNASPPIGCSASAVTSGNPATITLSNACAGFTGLTPGAQYYANGDGSITTANIGHPMGVATSTTQLTVIVK